MQKSTLSVIVQYHLTISILQHCRTLLLLKLYRIIKLLKRCLLPSFSFSPSFVRYEKVIIKFTFKQNKFFRKIQNSNKFNNNTKYLHF